MRHIRLLSLAYFLLTAWSLSVAQSIRGTVDSANGPVSGAFVSLFKNDSILSMCQTDGKGTFSLNCPEQGKYGLVISSLGYKDYEHVFSPDTLSAPFLFRLEENPLELDEVVVSGDRSQIIKRTANGQIFYLSEEAKKRRNPFQALQEIPTLISDEANSTVTMLDGKPPLILIDGHRMNSGINPINPSEIESVEVIDVVPARYLQDGYTGIVNIKLKRGKEPYFWTEVATRHDFPLYKGLGVYYFEVGNQNYSLYGRTAYNYTYNENKESHTERSNSTYSQAYDSSNRTHGHSWLGELLLKWAITPKDYLAAQLYLTDNKSTDQANGNGEYTETTAMPYSFSSRDVNKGKVFTSSIYYEHAFAENNKLEMQASYNYNRNNLNSERTEQYGEALQTPVSIFRNTRHSGNVDIDYARDYESGASFSLGSHTSGQFDEIDQTSTGYPIFNHRKLNEYVFGSYGGKAGKLYYMASAGMELIWLKAGDADHHYIRPRVSASATWDINDNNSLQLGYTLSNEAPDIALLNPYNTSTDSLVVSSGNPYLIPETSHSAELSYTFNQGGLYLTPSVSYTKTNDLIEADGFTENGIYHNTYNNLGHFSMMSYMLNLSYRFKSGRIGVYGGWQDYYYPGQRARGTFITNFDFSAKVKKFSFYAYMTYMNKSIYKISTTRYYRPTMVCAQVNYNFTPDFYIAFCLQDATGRLRSRTETANGSYNSVTHDRFMDRCLRPWVLVRYTFRKNPHRKIKLGNYFINNEEKGINIKK